MKQLASPLTVERPAAAPLAAKAGTQWLHGGGAPVSWSILREAGGAKGTTRGGDSWVFARTP